MRAWQVTRHGEPRDALRLAVDAPRPEPGPGQLAVEVAAAGVGLPDVYLCRGSYALTPGLPFTPGQEGVGTVRAVGPGCHARVGERVMGVSLFQMGFGTFADECLLLDAFSFPAPDELENAPAAGFVIPYHTAYIALVRRAALRAGETLLVLGAAGGSGSAALQLGLALGARVFATAGGPEKTQWCRDHGAEVALDYRSEDVAQRVRDATGGRGVDVVFDPVGGGAFEQATKCIAHEGRLLAVGFASGSWGKPSTPHLVTQNYSVLGVFPAGYDQAFRNEAQARLEEHRRAGRLRTAVHAALPFERLPEALALLAERSVTGKVAVCR